jgi:hypothetical protein
MRESSQLHYRMAYQGLTEREQDEAKLRKAIDERTAAVRRWIDDEDDDEPAVRGID